MIHLSMGKNHCSQFYQSSEVMSFSFYHNYSKHNVCYLRSLSMLHRNKNIALVGNPNSGKSSLFNLLPGLNNKFATLRGLTF